MNSAIDHDPAARDGRGRTAADFRRRWRRPVAILFVAISFALLVASVSIELRRNCGDWNYLSSYLLLGSLATALVGLVAVVLARRDLAWHVKAPMVIVLLLPLVWVALLTATSSEVLGRQWFSYCN